MQKTNMILESLAENRLFDEDMVGDMLTESIEFDSLWSEEYENFEGIDEAKSITFGGRAYPEKGWAVVTAGGAGSGKGYALNRQVLIDAKVLDVDQMKQMFAKVSSKKKDSEIAKYTGGRNFDFKNSKDVSDLHAIIGTELRLAKKKEALLFSSIKQGLKTNLIFDITGKSSTKLMNIANTVKKLGYKTSLVWIVTNRQVALMRNLLRSRVVGERLFHEIHNQVNSVLMDFLTSKDAKDYDEAWVLFSGSSEVSDLSVEAQRELFNNSVFKLKKKGDAFEISKELAEKIIDFLGPQEETPNEPTTYKNYKNIQKDLDPYIEIEGKNKGRASGYKNLNFKK